MSCLKYIPKRFGGSRHSNQRTVVVDAGTNFKTPNKPFSLLSGQCSPDGQGQFLTSGVGSLLSIASVTLPEAFSVSKVSLMPFLLSSLDDFCSLLIVLLVPPPFFFFCPNSHSTFPVRVSASFCDSSF